MENSLVLVNDLLQEFEQYMATKEPYPEKSPGRKYTESTIKHYVGQIKSALLQTTFSFERKISSDGSSLDLAELSIELSNSINSINKNRPSKISTNVQRTCSANLFFMFLRKKYKLINFPHIEYDSSNDEAESYNFLKREQYEELLSLIPETKKGFLHRGVILTSLRAGLTSTEIAGMYYSDINRTADNKIERIHVLSSREKERIVNIPQDLEESLFNYESSLTEKETAQLKKGESSYFFYASSRSIRKGFTGYARAANLIDPKTGRPFHFRILRKTFIKEKIGEGMDIVELARILGIDEKRAILLCKQIPQV